MSIRTWKMDPEKPGALIKVDEEEAAEEMWREICIEKGLPLNTPYVLNNDYKSMTWRESVCDGMWRDIYYRKGLIPNTFSDDSDDDQVEQETEKKRNRMPSPPPPIPPPENYRKVCRTFEEDMKMLEERWAKEAADRINKKKKKKMKAASAED